MTDAELMTTEPDVPGLEVAPASWWVWVNGDLLGTVWACIGEPNRFQSVCTIGGVAKTEYFRTRNDAVRWILDQHKAKGEPNA